MIEFILSIPPAFLFLIAALLVPLFKGPLKNIFVISIPLIGLLIVHNLVIGANETLSFLHYELTILRVDKLSKAFGYIFNLSAIAALIFGFYQKKSFEFSSILVYIGSALGVVFAGDLFSLYMFWELMAVFSTFLILARKTKKAMSAAKRYLLVHIVGGLVLLAGIIFHIHETGSIAFNLMVSQSLSSWLILVGLLINAAAIPLSSWLPDAYPEATVLGGVILSIYTTKTAVYTLIRGFAGWDILIGLGCAMAIYGLLYAILENDIRRILAYSIINQIGFKVCAVGIGTPLALGGAVAHVFCGIIYKSLLWMCAGAILHRLGKSKCTDLGGLIRSMPFTFVCCMIGVLALSAFPFTSGYTSKKIILLAAEKAHFFWPWLLLEIASAGVCLQAGLKFPYMIFFNKDKGLKPKKAPRTMFIGMGILAILTVYLGCFPEQLYNILPYSAEIKKSVPYTFDYIYIKKFYKLIPHMQMILFSAVAFFLLLPVLKRTTTITLDFDWFYRKGSRLIYNSLDRGLNGLNSVTHRLIAVGAVGKVSAFFQQAPANLALLLIEPVWAFKGKTSDQKDQLKVQFLKNIKDNNFPIGSSAILILVILAGLFIGKIYL